MIKELRVKKGWSQEELAEFSGLSVRTVQRIEQGAQPSRQSLRALSSTFSIPESELFASSATPNSEELEATSKNASSWLSIFSGTPNTEESDVTSKNAFLWASILIAAIWILSFFWGYHEGMHLGIAYFSK